MKFRVTAAFIAAFAAINIACFSAFAENDDTLTPHHHIRIVDETDAQDNIEASQSVQSSEIQIEVETAGEYNTETEENISSITYASSVSVTTSAKVSEKKETSSSSLNALLAALVFIFTLATGVSLVYIRKHID